MTVLGPVLLSTSLTLGTLLGASLASGQDVPVEKPSLDRPALPQTPPEPTKPAPESEARSEQEPERAQHEARAPRSERVQHDGRAPRAIGQKFVYLGLGVEMIDGLSGGTDFERTNAGLGGQLGIDFALGPNTGLGLELDGDLELSETGQRGAYSAVLFRARLSRSVARRARVWGALGLGRAGYETGSLAAALGAGTSFLFAPQFGLDLSANLHLLEAAGDGPAARGTAYGGGAVLLVALRALFEFHPGR